MDQKQIEDIVRSVMASMGQPQSQPQARSVDAGLPCRLRQRSGGGKLRAGPLSGSESRIGYNIRTAPKY